MSASPDFMQSLLGSLAPWMTGANPSVLDKGAAQYGGFSGLLSALMQGAGPNTTQARTGAALAQAQDNAFQQAGARQKLVEGNLGLARQKMMLDAAQQALQGDQPQGAGLLGAQPPTAGAAPGAAQPPGAPSAGPMSPPPTAAPQGGAPSMSQIYGTTYPGGTSPAYTRAMAMFSQDPAAALLKAREDQLKMAQQYYAPQISQLENIVQSDTPSRYVQANPQLQATWQRMAPQLGFDPQKDFNDANVRTAFAFASNGLKASLSQPTLAPPVQMEQLSGPLGQRLSRDPRNGEVKQEVAPQETEKFITPDGVRLMTKAEGIAKGYQPYSAPLLGAGNMTDQSKEFAYQWFLAHGSLPANYARSPMMQGAMMDYIAKRAKEDGNDAVSITANNQATKATQGVLKDFTSGKTSQTLNGLNTAISHMDQLDQAATALQNSNVQGLNKLSNFFKTQFGSDKVTNFNVVKNFAAGEVAKAVLPGGGGEREREEIADAIKNSNSPEQLHSAIQTWRNLLSGKTDALRNQWDTGTNGKQGSFDKFLLPATKKALGITDSGSASAHPKDIQDLLSKYGH